MEKGDHIFGHGVAADTYPQEFNYSAANSSAWLSGCAIILVSYFFVLTLIPSYLANLYAAPLGVMFVLMGLTLGVWVMPSNTALLFILASECYALMFHAFDGPSLLNILANTTSFLAIYLAVWKLVRDRGFEQAEKALFIILLTVFFVMFPVSTSSTVHYPTAPEQYFWQGATDVASRFQLMRGSSGITESKIGGSDATYVAGILLLWNEKFRKDLHTFTLRWGWHIFIALLCCYVIIASHQRIGFLILLEALLLNLAYKRFIGPKRIASINLVLFALYLAISLFEPLELVLTDIALNAQHALPAIRLISEDSQQESLLSGRELLNVQLTYEAGKDPLTGQGHSAAILKYGVNSAGSVSESDTDKAAGTESGLRLAVAYGYPYYLLQLLFMAWPTIKAIRGRSLDPLLSCTISGVVVLTFAIDGGFDNWYTITVLFGMLTVLYTLD